jgi:hypothetical protein
MLQEQAKMLRFSLSFIYPAYQQIALAGQGCDALSQLFYLLRCVMYGERRPQLLSRVFRLNLNCFTAGLKLGGELEL